MGSLFHTRRLVLYHALSALALFLLLSPVHGLFASTTDGTIDPTNKYAKAYNDSFGRFNFGTTEGNVHVTDAGLSGYVWSERYGWINLAPTNGGVNNNAEGTLTGYAWGEKTGWINFNPTNAGVEITDSGFFDGHAWGERVGWIVFDCGAADACVETDWRPATVRSGVVPPGGGPSPTATSTGSLKITNYVCPPGTSVSRGINGPTISGTHIAPSGCTRAEGTSFGYIYEPYKSTTGAPYPGLNGEVPFTYLGTTNGSGELVVSGLYAVGRYDIAEVYNHTQQIPSSKQFGLFCWGDNGTGTDNYDFTFIPTDGLSHCVAYRAADICPNISGVQTTVPGGMLIDSAGNCVTPPSGDMCPNIAGVQTSMPPGLVLNTAGECVPIEEPDVCPNMAGTQTDVPVGMQFDEDGNCIPVGTDFCPNIPGVQDTVPAGMEINPEGECVLISEPDVCPNISGKQTSVPVGMIIDGAGNCVAPPITPDVCLNISGDQPTVPPGMVVDGAGNCIPEPQTTDACPNIPGNQPSIPAGLVYNAQGECVAPIVGGDVCPNITGDQQSLPIGMRFDMEGNCIAAEYVPPPTEPEIPCEDGTILTSLGCEVKEAATGTIAVVAEITKEIIDLVETPEVQRVTQTVSVTGIVTAGTVAATSLFLNSLTLGEMLLIPLRLWALLMSLLGLRKKYKPWGTVYDSVTKQPLDPAYVVLQDLSGNEIATSITDLDGRYGFLVAPGTYTLVANKTNYIFPSKKLLGKTQDELYPNLYFGEQVVISGEGSVIDKNIPLDPEHFDWNEFAKADQKLLRFYSKRDRLISRITDWFFRIGFVVALVSLFIAPEPYNIAIFALYIVLVLMRRYGFKPKAHGVLTELETGKLLSFAVVRIVSPALQKEIFHKVADKLGRYYCLVPKGTYIVRIEKKNEDGSYTQVFESQPLSASKGIINQDFKI